MSLATNITDLATRIATECKSLRTLINGNVANLSSLTTTDKTNLVAAINEVFAAVGAGGVMSLDGLTDVVITSAATGDIIRYNGTNWVDVDGTTIYQPLDADLTTIAGLTATTDNMIQSVGSAWASRTPAQVRTALALVPGTNIQAYDATLLSIAALGTAADRMIYTTGVDTWAELTTTSYGRAIAALANQAALMALLSAASATVQGIVELATTAETTTGTDAVRAVTPQSLHDMTSLAGAVWFLDEDNMASNSDTKVASQQSVKAYVDASVVGLYDLKGSTDTSTNPNYPAASKGDAYVVSVAGKIGGASGTSVDIGDVYLATADNAGGTQAGVGASWTVLEHNLVGAMLAANNLSDVASAATAFSNIKQAATATATGVVELLTDAETTTGTDTSRAMTAANLTSQIGSRLQAYDSDLNTIAGLTATTDNFIVAVASAWASRTPAQVKTTLDIGDTTTDFVATFNTGLV